MMMMMMMMMMVTMAATHSMVDVHMSALAHAYLSIMASSALRVSSTFSLWVHMAPPLIAQLHPE
jgi:hypothetical protein